MKSLLAKVTGTDKTMDESVALATLRPEETSETAALIEATVESVNEIVESSAIAAASPMLEEDITEAYGVSYDEKNRTYTLYRFHFNEAGDVKFVGKEHFGKYLAEVQSKMSKMIVGELMWTMSANIKKPVKKKLDK